MTIQDLLEKHNLRHGIELDAKVLDEFVKELEALIAREVTEAKIEEASKLRRALDYLRFKKIKRENLKRYLDERIAELQKEASDVRK